MFTASALSLRRIVFLLAACSGGQLSAQSGLGAYTITTLCQSCFSSVFIDNLPLGHPVYNNPRVDIETLFPGFANTDGAVGYYYIDTTMLSNGLHSIAWSAKDNAGNAMGLGSRYFYVQIRT
jgi:hypothetical protein